MPERVHKKQSLSLVNWSIVWKLLILGIALFINIVLAVRLFFGPQSALSYFDLRKEYLQLSANLNAEELKNLTLSREIRLLQSDERYLEKIIRQRLNYVKENEVLYLFNAEQAGIGGKKGAGKN